jgi:hypothetical protein
MVSMNCDMYYYSNKLDGDSGRYYFDDDNFINFIYNTDLSFVEQLNHDIIFDRYNLIQSIENYDNMYNCKQIDLDIDIDIECYNNINNLIKKLGLIDNPNDENYGYYLASQIYKSSLNNMSFEIHFDSYGIPIQKELLNNNKIIYHTITLNGSISANGFKAAITETNQMCIVSLYISNKATVITDDIIDKKRTSEVNVVSIDPVVYLNNTYYFVKEILKIHEILDQNCAICYNNEINVIIRPCLHLLCKSCSSVLKICPFCRGNISCSTTITTSLKKIIKQPDIINSLKKIKLNPERAYSFIHNSDFYYEVKKNIIVSDFDRKNKTCSAGIHYHSTIDKVFRWFEFCDIPENLILDMFPKSQGINNDIPNQSVKTLSSFQNIVVKNNDVLRNKIMNITGLIKV